jgi:SMC interacting uncharacterized protein involved in chromosome segregation
MTITNDIKDAIKKNLSSEVSEVLQEELAKVTTLENDIKITKFKVDQLNQQLMTAEQKLLELSSYQNREKEVQEREATVKKEKYEIELTIANNRLDNFKNNYDHLLELTKVIFRSPVTKQTVMEHGSYTTSDGVYRPTNKNSTILTNIDTSDNTCT